MARPDEIIAVKQYMTETARLDEYNAELTALQVKIDRAAESRNSAKCILDRLVNAKTPIRTFEAGNGDVMVLAFVPDGAGSKAVVYVCPLVKE